MFDYDVLFPSGYGCDLIFTGLPEVPRLGADLFGAGFDMAPAGNFLTVATLHRLGLRVRWATDLGNDLFSRFVLEAIQREGLDMRFIRVHDFPLRNISVSFSFTDDRGFVSFAEAFEEPSPLSIIEGHPPRCLLAPHLSLALDQPEALAVARKRGSLIYLDCQFTRVTPATSELAEALRLADVFAPNASEARQLTGAENLDEALTALAELTSIVVIKCGAEGAIARRGAEVVHAPAIPVNVVDTTGAGDCFNAGFVYAWLGGEPLDVCLRYGNVCGGLSTTAHGSTFIPGSGIHEWLRDRLG